MNPSSQILDPDPGPSVCGPWTSPRASPTTASCSSYPASWAPARLILTTSTLCCFRAWARCPQAP